MTRTQEIAHCYAEAGLAPIPVPIGEKGPKCKDWPQLRLRGRDIPKHFDHEPTNIGLVLGVNGLADVDLDCEEALSVADHFLPQTGFVFGRRSRPQSHYGYWLDKPIPTKKYLDPLAKGNRTILELRCTKRDGEIGLQTIVPPSVHPSGERIRFYGEGDPARITSDMLIEASSRAAAAALLVRHWPGEQCGRNEAFLALGGTLARAAMSLEDVTLFVQGVYRGLFGAEADMQQAAREVAATFEKASKNEATTGFTHLSEFVDQRIVRRCLLWLNVNDKTPPAAPAAQAATGSKSQATILVGLASSAKFFHTGDGEPYVSCWRDGHLETWRVRDKEFKRWLAKEYYDQEGRAPNSQALNDAITVLEGKALFDGEQHEVFVRIARLGRAIYVDLGDQSWRAVKVTKRDWTVVRNPKVKFRRPRGMLELPEPVQGGSIEELREFTNTGSSDDWVVYVAWLIGAFQPDYPFPLLVVQGEQGSAKSTTERVLRSLIDPNKSPLRSPPRDIRDIMIAAQNSWVVAFDNISYLPAWLSDGLCSLATGGGFSTRELYSDTQETIFAAKRPILLNGIDGVVVRGDALDRALVVNQPEITESMRRPEAELWMRFRKAQPRILGALLHAVAGALRNRLKVQISELPRMADFTIWATAAEAALGWRKGTVVKAVLNNQNATKTLPLDASPIVPALRRMLRANEGSFKGTAAALLEQLKLRTSRDERPKGWPANAQVLSGQLRRLAPNLRAADVRVIFHQTSGSGSTKVIEIINSGNFCDAGDARDAHSEDD